MRDQRLARLVRLMMELGRKPFRSVDEAAGLLAISRTQFYRDKEDLEKMGFSFTFRRERGAFQVEDDPGVRVDGLTLGEVLALILAVEKVPLTGDFPLAYRALLGLRKISVDRPGPAARLVALAIEAVTREIAGCGLDLLERLVAAAEEKRRIIVEYRGPESGRTRRLTVDAQGLVYRRGKLCLEILPLQGRALPRRLRADSIQNLMETPFLAPQ